MTATMGDRSTGSRPTVQSTASESLISPTSVDLVLMVLSPPHSPPDRRQPGAAPSRTVTRLQGGCRTEGSPWPAANTSGPGGATGPAAGPGPGPQRYGACRC